MVRRSKRPEPGFTLLEVLVVLAVITLITGTAVRGFRAVNKSDLRTAASHMAGAMHYLFDRASTTGKIHRLVIDIDEGSYHAEASDDRFFIPRERETDLTREKAAEEEQRELEQDERRAETMTQQGYDLTTVVALEFKPKRARFAAFKETALKPKKLARVAVRSVFTPRLADPLTAGQAYVYFFPMGQAEPAYVHLSDPEGENTFTLVLHPLTGRVRVHDGNIEPPVDERTDDEGNEVVEER